MTDYDLHETARALVAEGKGILAADESGGTIKKRFDSIGLESTEENRRAYRDMLFTTPGAEDYISGVILFDETIRQQALDGTPFPELLASKGIIPGIKVDEGAKPLAGAEGETVTEGLDGLRARLEEYRGLGARFAKWRATYTITDDAAERLLHLDERARARALRGALPGGGDRPDRRARGPAGRHAHDRAQLPRHLPRPRRGLHGAVRPEGRRRGHPAEAEHGALRLLGLRPRGRGRGRGLDAEVLLQARAGGGPRDRLPLRRPVGRGRDGAHERDEREGPAPVGDLVLVRPCAPGARDQGVGRQGGERRGGAARLLPPREDEQRRPHRGRTRPRWSKRP